MLDSLDHVVVHEWDLWQDYDGPSKISWHADDRPTWWLRFFDYL